MAVHPALPVPVSSWVAHQTRWSAVDCFLYSSAGGVVRAGGELGVHVQRRAE